MVGKMSNSDMARIYKYGIDGAVKRKDEITV